MGFEKFGRMSFVPFTKVSEFVAHLKDGKLKGTKCKKCAEFYFPPRADCAECLTSDMEWVALSGKGTLISYTTIHAAPAGFEEDAPYSLGIIELEEGGKLLAHIEDIDDIKIGMKLKVEIKISTEDRVMYVIRE